MSRYLTIAFGEKHGAISQLIKVIQAATSYCRNKLVARMLIGHGKLFGNHMLLVKCPVSGELQLGMLV